MDRPGWVMWQSRRNQAGLLLVGDGVVGNRVLFWPLVGISCLLVVLTEIVVKQPVVILRTAFRDKIRASGCQHRSGV